MPDAEASPSINQDLPAGLPGLRIFVSSPGDVDTERRIAERVIGRLAGEFHGRLTLEAYFWEDEPMRQQATFQDQIPPTSEFDVVLCILWSRLGTPLKGPDGREYPSGTDYEVESARAAYAETGKPELMLYLNQTPAQIRQVPREERERMIRQLEALEAFVERHCVDRQSGVIKGAFTSYRDLGQFEDLLEKHLRHLVAARLPAGEGDAADTPRAAAVTWQGRPYQGLRAFDFEHSPIFFGRTRAVGEVLALLRQRAVRLEEARAAAVGGVGEDIDPAAAAFVLVCAMSGVGKSSLVRAGVLPLLTQPGGGVGLWRRVVLRPSETPAGGDLFDALAQALTAPHGLPELLGGISGSELAFMLRRNPAGLELLLKQALGQAAEGTRRDEDARLREEERLCREAGRVNDLERLANARAALAPPVARLAVVIDQMEELFTLDQVTPEARRHFAQALTALARSGAAWVIGTLRSDFFGRCAEVPELMELKAGALYDLQPPTPEELGQMIRRPAQAAGLSFERHAATDAALDEAVRDVAARSPEALPLLEFALDGLYERRDARGRLTWMAYEEIGGLEGALAAAAEEALGGLRQWQQETFDHVMGGLVTLGTGAGESVAHRRTADYATLTAPPGARAFVDGFIAARLFVADQDTAGHAIVSVAHEALLGRRAAFAASPAAGGKPAARAWLWTRLGKWVEANADFLRGRARVAASLKQWQDAGGNPDFLLPAGRPLLDGEALLRDHPQALSREEGDYILRSMAAGSQRRRRSARLRAAVMAGLGLLAAGAGVGAWFGFQGERKAQAQAEVARQKTVEAEKQAGLARDKTHEAETAAARAERAAAETLAQLRLASLSDVATAKDFVAKGNWREAVAYLDRALKEDRDNRLAAAWLWSEIVYGPNEQRDALPLFTISSPDEIHSLVYRPDGSRLLAVCKNGNLRQWDAVTGQPVGEVIHSDGDRHETSYSPDGSWIMSVSGDGHDIRQWDATTGQTVGKAIHCAADVNNVSYRPDGGCLLGITGETVQQWDATTGQTVGKAMPGVLHTPDGDCMASATRYSPDGKRILIYFGNEMQLCAAATGQAIGKPLHHEMAIFGYTFSPDGTRVATGDKEGIVQQWDAATGKPLGQPLRAGGEFVFTVAYSPDGTRLLATSGDYTKTDTVRQWDAATGELIGNTLHPEVSVASADYNADGTRILITCRADNKPGFAREWNADLGAPLGEPLRGDSPVSRADYAPDGLHIATLGENGAISVRATTAGAPVAEPMFSDPAPANRALAVSPDGTRIVSFGGEGGARQWDATTGEQIGGTLNPGHQVEAAAYRGDHQRLVLGKSGDTIQQWDAATGQLIGPAILCDGVLAALAYSPDGTRILAVCNEAIQQWDAATGQPLGKSLPLEAQFYNAAYSPDGRRIVSAGEDKTARQWDAATGQPIGGPMFHEDTVYSAAYSPDGRRIVTDCKDGLVREWDAVTGQPLGSPPPGQEGKAVYLAGGTRLLVAGSTVIASDRSFPETSPPPWLDDFLAGECGLHFDAHGELQSLTDAERAARLAALRTAFDRAGPAGADEWERMGRWALAPAGTRPYTPRSRRSSREVLWHWLEINASEAADPVLRIMPSLPLVHLALAVAADNPQRAEFLRRYEVSHLPGDAPTLVRAAEGLRRQNRPRLALVAAERAHAAAPDLFEARVQLAGCLCEVNRNQEAMALYDALPADARMAGAEWATAAYAAAKLGRSERARELLRRALALSPDDPWTLRAAGWTLFNLKAPAEALDAFSKCKEKTFNEPIYHDICAGAAISAWSISGAKDEAAELYAPALNPQAQEGYNDPAKIRAMDRSDAEKAALLAVLAETLRRNPDLAPGKGTSNP